MIILDLYKFQIQFIDDSIRIFIELILFVFKILSLCLCLFTDNKNGGYRFSDFFPFFLQFLKRQYLLSHLTGKLCQFIFNAVQDTLFLDSCSTSEFKRKNIKIRSSPVTIQQMQDSQNDKLNGNTSNILGKSKGFVCSCGKSYINYSSLYVHMMVKHNVKISSKNITTSITSSKNQHENISDNKEFVDQEGHIEKDEKIETNLSKGKFTSVKLINMPQKNANKKEKEEKNSVQKEVSFKEFQDENWINQKKICEILEDYADDYLIKKGIKISIFKKKYLSTICNLLLEGAFTEEIDSLSPQVANFFKRRIRNERTGEQNWERVFQKMLERIMHSEYMLKTLYIDAGSEQFKIFSKTTEDFFRWLLNKEAKMVKI